MSGSDLDKLNRLKSAGFSSIGIWRQGEHISPKAPKEPGVYAFVTQGEVMYVGSSKGSPKRTSRKRIGEYETNQDGNADDRLVHREIAEVHKIKGEIEVYTLVLSPWKLYWNALPIDLVTGLEAGLIRDFDPKWNRRGRGSIATKSQTKAPLGFS
jgi:hypothetical protein